MATSKVVEQALDQYLRECFGPNVHNVAVMEAQDSGNTMGRVNCHKGSYFVLITEELRAQWPDIVAAVKAELDSEKLCQELHQVDSPDEVVVMTTEGMRREPRPNGEEA